MKHKFSSSRQMSILGIDKVGTTNFSSRCIKPNDKKLADLFDQERVMTQLKYTGVLETTRLRKEVGLANIANRKYQFKKVFVFTNGCFFNEANIMQHCCANNVARCWTKISSSSQHHPTQCSNEANMLHPTMLDDVGPTCWLRLNRRLDIIYCFNFILGLFRTDYLSRIRAQVFIGLTL